MRKRRAQRKKEVQGEGGVQGPFQEARAPRDGLGWGVRAAHGVSEFSPAHCNLWEVAGSSPRQSSAPPHLRND